MPRPTSAAVGILLALLLPAASASWPVICEDEIQADGKVRTLRLDRTEGQDGGVTTGTNQLRRGSEVGMHERSPRGEPLGLVSPILILIAI